MQSGRHGHAERGGACDQGARLGCANVRGAGRGGEGRGPCDPGDGCHAREQRGSDAPERLDAGLVEGGTTGDGTVDDGSIEDGRDHGSLSSER